MVSSSVSFDYKTRGSLPSYYTKILKRFPGNSLHYMFKYLQEDRGLQKNVALNELYYQEGGS
jgi:hypothetical protein